MGQRDRKTKKANIKIETKGKTKESHKDDEEREDRRKKNFEEQERKKKLLSTFREKKQNKMPSRKMEMDLTKHLRKLNS